MMLTMFSKLLKQNYAEIGIMCNLAPPTVSESNATVVNPNETVFEVCSIKTLT